MVDAPPATIEERVEVLGVPDLGRHHPVALAHPAPHPPLAVS
jgi:hypothetical protein